MPPRRSPSEVRRRRRLRDHARGEPRGRDGGAGRRLEGRGDQPGVGRRPVVPGFRAVRGRAAARCERRPAGARAAGTNGALALGRPHPRASDADGGHVSRERRRGQRSGRRARVDLPAGDREVPNHRDRPSGESGSVPLRRRAGGGVAGSGGDSRLAWIRALRNLQLGPGRTAGGSQRQVLDAGADARSRGVGSRAVGRPPPRQRFGAFVLPGLAP